VAYGGLLVLWPFDEGQRFLFPIHPLLLTYGIDGLNAVSGWVVRTALPAVAGARILTLSKAGLFGVIVAAGVVASVPLALRNRKPQPPVTTNSATLSIVDWLRANTGEDAAIMADEAAIVHRLTGRRTYRFPLLTDPQRIHELIDETRTSYIVVLDERGPAYFRPSTMVRFEAVRAYAADRFELVHDFGAGWVFRVMPAS
jgi:hypothetical protein